MDFPPSSPQAGHPSRFDLGRKKLLALFVASGAIVVLALAYGIYRGTRWFSGRMATSQIDQSQASFEARENESIYTNPKYGVTLRLPGKWKQEVPPPNGFCNLVQENGPGVFLWATPRIAGGNFEQYVNSMRRVLAPAREYDLIQEQSLAWKGRPGRMYVYQQRQLPAHRQAFLFFGAGIRIYVLWASTRTARTGQWKNLLARLPESLEAE